MKKALSYNLGDMRRPDGSVLWYEVEEKVSEYALRISRELKSAAVYSELRRRLPTQRIDLYIQYNLKEAIYRFVRDGVVIQWYKKSKKVPKVCELIVLIPRDDIFAELKKCWNIEDVPLEFVRSLSIRNLHFVLYKAVRFLKNICVEMTARIYDLFQCPTHPIIPDDVGMIACHYLEGVDLSKRSDIQWYSEDIIPAEKVLIYFNNHNHRTGRPINRNVIQEIDRRGFKWVALKKRIIEGQGNIYWKAPMVPRRIFLSKKSAHTDSEKWLADIGNKLLKNVFYWQSFHKTFKVKIHYVPEETYDKTIEQAIAFDIERDKVGVLAGRQRSEIFLPSSSSLLFNPRHVYFVWNGRIPVYLDDEKVQTFLIGGHPNDIFRKYKNRAKTLCDKGVQFVLTLFDDTYSIDSCISGRSMARFYEAVLQWVISDSAIGLIIKAKKPSVIKGLPPPVISLLNQALGTGRIINIEDPWGRLPSEASFGTDMAIAIGISTALLESAITGCRSILYDVTGLKGHEFYAWGYKRIIFDDLDEMINVLRLYKNDATYFPGLGDWSAYRDRLDPFLDGEGGMRMGTYFSWLLDSFENKMNRDEAVLHSNKRYAEKWGRDKVIVKKEG